MAADAEEIPQNLKIRYSNFRLLGSGAMGRVYKATDNDLLIDVAIKVLLGNRGPSSDAAIRFQREAQAASKLTHRNLVTVMDFGITSGEQLYLVMEFAKGRTLESIVNKKTVSLDKVVNVVSQICDAMSHAHSLGVVHRDLKPANIIVDGENLNEASIKVVDFGVAKIGDGGGTASSITQHGELLGTPQFMSPEQISSKPDIDGRSDIYSVGCIMFYLLAGRYPHEGNTILELLQSKSNDIAPRINEVVGHAPVPHAVEDVVARCLSASPVDRFSTMLELKKELVLASQQTGDSMGSDTGRAVASLQTVSPVTKSGLVLLVPAALLTVAVIVLINQILSDKRSSVTTQTQAELPGEKSNEKPLSYTANLHRLFQQSSEDSSWTAKEKISDDDLKLLLDQNVRGLKVSAQMQITDDACLYISRMPNLKSLSITDSRIGDKGLAFLSRCPKLSKLDLGGTYITDQGLASIAALPINDLGLDRTQVTSAGMKYVAKLKTLGRFKINDTDFDDEGLKAIVNLPLECLHAEKTNITDKGMKFFPGRKTLARLHLEATSIGEPGLRQIASYPLCELNLLGCKKVDDRCIDFVCRTWPNLGKLVVSKTNVTGEGIKKIARLRHLRDLKVDVLHLSDQDFSPIFEIKTLKELSLHGVPITDKTLARICELPDLEILDISDCKGTTAGGRQAMRARCTRLGRADPRTMLQEDASIEALTNIMK